MRVTAIDPQGCGCPECLTGEYVPLDRARASQVKAMLKGKILNNTGLTFIKTQHAEDGMVTTVVTPAYRGATLSWRWEKVLRDA